MGGHRRLRRSFRSEKRFVDVRGLRAALVSDGDRKDRNIRTRGGDEGARMEWVDVVAFEGRSLREDRDPMAFFEHTDEAVKSGGTARLARTIDEDGAGLSRHGSEHRPPRDVGAAEHVSAEGAKHDRDVDRASMVGDDREATMLGRLSDDGKVDAEDAEHRVAPRAL